MATNILLNPLPDKAVARWSPVNGRAIIELPTGEVYSYEPKGKDGILKQERMGFHSGMWLQPAMAASFGKPIELHEAGEYPFTKLREHIAFRLRVNDAIDSFLMSMDPELDAEYREMRKRRLVRLLEDEKIRDVVEPIFLRQPIPGGFDTSLGPTEGHAGRILREVIARLPS